MINSSSAGPFHSVNDIGFLGQTETRFQRYASWAEFLGLRPGLRPRVS